MAIAHALLATGGVIPRHVYAKQSSHPLIVSDKTRGKSVIERYNNYNEPSNNKSRSNELEASVKHPNAPRPHTGSSVSHESQQKHTLSATSRNSNQSSHHHCHHQRASQPKERFMDRLQRVKWNTITHFVLRMLPYRNGIPAKPLAIHRCCKMLKKQY